MNELFKILGLVAVDNSGANAALDETTDKANESHANMSKAFSKIGSAAVAVGKTVAVGLGAAATAIGGIAKTALDSYADYEQLVGGVDTLFKDSSKKVQEYADNAYKTAGLSANEYMETVTSFSASLLQGLDGDTDRAAEIANRAITDMSDNANKMGTDMSMIQNAYQGFAKQNYTMLDNLKLGYGGTASEMARLINDSGVLGDSMEVTAETVNEVSFDKIIEAIGVVQDKMGITGTTAKEASATISGSLSSMKSAWTNLLTGLGSEDADLSGLMDQFVDSVITVGKNIIPRIKVILNGITKAIGKLMPKLGEQLPSMMQDILPSLIEGAVALFNGLVTALPTLLKILIEQVPFIVTQIAQALMDALPVLIDTVRDMMGELWDFISLEVLNTGVSFEDALSVMSNAFASLWQTAQQVWNDIGHPIWDVISFAIGELVGMFQQHMPAIEGFFANAMEGMKDTWENHLKPIYDAIVSFLNDELKPAFEYVFVNIIEPIVEGVFNTIGNLWNNTLKPVFDGICDFLLGIFTQDFEKAFGGILGIFSGLLSGIGTILGGLLDTVKNIFGKVVDSIKGAFNFKVELPKIKLPHFSVKPKGWQIGDLLQGSIPTLGIEWYAKGGVLKEPTIFGMNGNNAMVGGEAGAEAVAPIDVLQGYVADAVASQNAGLVDALDRILEAIIAMDENMGGNLRNALDGTALKVGEREFARLVNRSVSRTQANEVRVGGAYV